MQKLETTCCLLSRGRIVTCAAILSAIFLAFQPIAARALSDAGHKKMLKNSTNYAKADAELNRAWKDLRAALKRVGLDYQFDGGQELPGKDRIDPGSLLADQRNWLSPGGRRDKEAEELRGSGSKADGYAAATRKRAAELRESAEELNRFAALPAPSPNAPIMRLLKAKGGSLTFYECPEDETGNSASVVADASSPASYCAKMTNRLNIYINIRDDGGIDIIKTGRGHPYDLSEMARWKLAADGRIVTIQWRGAWYEFTLHDGRYLRLENETIPSPWFWLHGDRLPKEGGEADSLESKKP